MLTLGLIGFCPSHGLRGETASATAKQPVVKTSRVHAAQPSTSCPKRYRATQTKPQKLQPGNSTRQYHSRSYFASRGYSVRIFSRMRTSGYSRFDPGMPKAGRTASGTPAVFGAIASDPRVIPAGTKVYVPGYGYGVVRDRGRVIKGKRLDCCYNTHEDALKHGIKYVDVFVLEPIKQKVAKS